MALSIISSISIQIVLLYINHKQMYILNYIGHLNTNRTAPPLG
jgi:hypothetical protein